MRSLPAATDQFGVFTAAQALDVGWSRPALARARGRGDILRLSHGHYIAAVGLDDSVAGRRRLACAAAIAGVLAVHGSVVSACSSAIMAGLPVLTVPNRPCLTMPPGASGTAVTAHLHRARLSADEVVGGRRAARTSSARSIVDIARENGVEEALVVADAALAGKKVTGEQLAEAVDRQHGYPGVRAARELLGLWDGRSESPLESISRIRLLAVGTAGPQLQSVLTDTRGRFLGRSDFYWDEFGVVGEADGLGKYDTIDAIVAEKLRQERLEEAGVIVVRWGWRDLNDMPRLRARLEQAFIRGSRRAGSERAWRVSETARP